MNAKFLMIIVFGFLIANGLSAQDTLTISKGDLIRKVAEGNLQLQISEQNFKSSKADYHRSNSLFLPNISASHTAISTTNPLMAFGSKLNQEILGQADFNPALLNDPDAVQNYATRIEVLQPILNFDGVYMRKAARAKMEAYQLQAGRTEEYLELEARKVYMRLQLAYKAVEVLKKAQKTALANGRLIGDYYEQGLLQKTDVLSMQVRINEVENQLQNALSNVRNESDYLNFLMNHKLTNIVYRPIDELSEEVAPEWETLQFSGNRKDILAMDKSVEAYGKMAKAEKFALFPRLNAFGSYELYDDTLFGTDAGGYIIGAQLSWNLFDGYKAIGKLQKVKVEYEKAQFESAQYKSQSQLELNKADRQLTDAESGVKLAKLNFEQSEEAYRIRQNRFGQGLEKTTDLLLSETQMFQKELEYQQAVFEYNFAKNYVSFLKQ
ncbi:MAG TPA: TolC family protein [Arenibacter sp.]|nr:TolC family protein [Arenibacter sp.]